MRIFDIDENEMEKTKSTHTLKEISQQPSTWLKTLEQLKGMKKQIIDFISNVISCDDFDVIFTGAGTSEFIGNALYSSLNKELNYKVKSYATTDIVASPESYLSKDKATLLVSFGRSGNSPESIGAVEVATRVCNNLYNLFITCNKDGALSKMVDKIDNSLAINLTDETHDQSFAMTSSFTNMYLVAYLSFNMDKLDEKSLIINKIASATEEFLNSGYKIAKTIVDQYDFNRIVYLGSNTLKGIAQESALKMLELSAGKTVAIFDTPLGFRHGPKSIIDDTTLVVVYVSNNMYTCKYEEDLIREISGQRKGNKLVVISDKPSAELESLADYAYGYNIGGDVDNVELGLAYISFAQTLSLLKSLKIGLTPDNPCPSGEVNRVVKGVTLYQYN